MAATDVKRTGRGRTEKSGRGSLLFALLGVLVLVGVGPLVSVAWKLIAINKDLLKTSCQEYQLLLASEIGKEVDVHVEGLRAQLVRLSKALGADLARRGAVGEGEIRGLLSEFADVRMPCLRFAPANGANVDSRGTLTLTPELEPVFATGFRSAAEILARARDASTDMAAASEPFLLSGTPPRSAILLSIPVVSGGVFRGVLSGLVDLQTIWDSVLGDRHLGHAVYVVDAHGRLLASRDFGGRRAGADLSAYPIVRRFLENPGHATETAPFRTTDGGFEESYLGSYEPTRERWAVIVQARERDIYLAVHTMVESTLSWALLALSLALLGAVFFARTLSLPIRKVAAASRAYATGDFSARVDVRSRNEIGELADTFNKMADELESLIRRLRKAVEEQNELFLGTARAMAEAIDAKDPYTRGHSVRVNRYSVILARYHGLSEGDIRDIHVASLLHDVGKIGVDDSILKKPAPLTREEFEVMKQHPVLGASILAPIRQMQKIVPGLRSHHERWRGGGYPDGLAGDGIPLMARIIAVADTFDAMTTDRPYQKGMSFDAALARLNELKGVVLDDRVVDSFNRAYRAGEFRPPAATPASTEPALGATAV